MGCLSTESHREHTIHDTRSKYGANMRTVRTEKRKKYLPIIGDGNSDSASAPMSHHCGFSYLLHEHKLS